MLRHLRHQSVPTVLRGPILLDAGGLPRYWASVWLIVFAGDLAATTRLKKLRAIEALYQHAEASEGRNRLDDALASLDDTSLSAILESWFVSICNRSERREADELRWRAGLDFVRSIFECLATVRSSDADLVGIERRLHRLKTLYRQLHVRRSTSTESIRSLPANTVESLYAMLDPSAAEGSPLVRVNARWRTYIAFVLMLHQGLRRGELLLLQADCIKSAIDEQRGLRRYWINVRNDDDESAELDPRHSRPSLKNAGSVRQLPVSELTATLVQTYTENYRGRPNHPYLLNSQGDRPFSTESLTKLFALVSTHLPSSVRRELEDRTGKRSITPHDLRHTCAVVRLQQLLSSGDSMDEALQKMRSFFGWSRASTMPSLYARAVFEDRLAGIWNNAFDERVNLVRALPRTH